MLTAKQRAFLRSKSHSLPDLVHVGKEGVTANVIKQVSDNLLAHELIKVKVQVTSDESARSVAETVATKTKSTVVCVVGNKVVLYKLTTKKGFNHYL